MIKSGSQRCFSRRQRGFTLVELMVGLVIGIIVLSGAMYVFVGNSESNIYQLRSTRFVGQMRDAMDRMVMDIRRAGYMGYQHYAQTTTVSIDNPFSSNSVGGGGVNTALTIDGSCITYAYNLDDDYPVMVGSGTTDYGAEFETENLEMFGFRLQGGTLQMRTGSGGSTTFDCNNGSWSPITSSDVVNITNLSFSEAATECHNVTDASRGDCNGAFTPGDTTDDTTPADSSDNPVSGDLLIVVREVHINMSGAHPDYGDAVINLSQTVDLPNDRAHLVP